MNQNHSLTFLKDYIICSTDITDMFLKRLHSCHMLDSLCFFINLQEEEEVPAKSVMPYVACVLKNL
jgi:hypothetical protein